MFEKCEFCEKWDFENVNFVKMRLWKYDFCEKWDFESVNFVKSEIFKIWILDKIRIFAPVWITEFLANG